MIITRRTEETKLLTNTGRRYGNHRIRLGHWINGRHDFGVGMIVITAAGDGINGTVVDSD
ncbi:hypothetical protein HanIR_Chr04g0151291 [Helianthus annuus]|nr:hypothetical protein HanIR_Chr04g0151291 [Helianthus annuus]